MTGRERLVQWLRQSLPLRQIVGDRIHHQRRPQGAKLPAVVYTITNRASIKDLDGTVPLTKESVKIECKAMDTATLDKIRDAVEAIEGFHDPSVQWVWQEDTSESLDLPIENDEQGVQTVTVEITLWVNTGV